MRIIVLIGLLLLSSYGIDSPFARTRVQQTEHTKELAKAHELSAQVLKLYDEKKYHEALPIAQRVLEIRQRLLPPDDLLVGAALINLAELYLVTKKDADAERLFSQALVVHEAHASESQIIISRLLNSLAYLRLRKHNYDQAEPLLLRSLEIQEKELGPANATTVEAMKDYACINIRNRAGRQDLFGNGTNQSKLALKGRAMCWLSGFLSNCAEATEASPQGVLNGKAIRLVQPAYPVEARQKRLTGSTFIAVLIDKEGNVVDAKAVCGGYRELTGASILAARQSKFTPTKLNGQAVQVTGVIVYNFIAQ